MSIESLWGTLPIAAKIETPVSILRSQASALEKLTSGRLTGHVITEKGKNDWVYHLFRIVAPALSNYSVDILSLRHGVMIYPVRVEVASADESMDANCANPEELKASLEEILQSERTRAIVTSLFAQIEDESTPSLASLHSS